MSRNGVYAAQCGLPADFLDTVESSGSDKAQDPPGTVLYRAWQGLQKQGPKKGTGHKRALMDQFPPPMLVEVMQRPQ